MIRRSLFYLKCGTTDTLLEDLKVKADTNLKRSFSFIAQLAKQFNVDIIAGSVSNIRDNNVYNTAFSVNKDGELINEYDKVHLVPMLREPEFLTDGNKVPEPFNCQMVP